MPAPAAPALPYKRDTMLRNDDIAGSTPSAFLTRPTRENHTTVDDIPGTSSRARTLG